MFLIGDKVVHPMHGAGIIERITHERLGSQGQQLLCVPHARRGACAEDPHRCLLPDRPAVSVHGGAHLPGTLRHPTLGDADVLQLEPALPGQSGRLEKRRPAGGGGSSRASCGGSHRRGLSNGERKMLHSAKQILISEVVLVEGTDDYPAVEQRINEAMMLGA